MNTSLVDAVAALERFEDLCGFSEDVTSNVHVVEFLAIYKHGAIGVTTLEEWKEVYRRGIHNLKIDLGLISAPAPLMAQVVKVEEEENYW